MILIGVLLGLLLGLLFGGRLDALVNVRLRFTLLLLGFCVEYAAWTVGLGAIALLRFERR